MPLLLAAPGDCLMCDWTARHAADDCELLSYVINQRRCTGDQKCYLLLTGERGRNSVLVD